MGDGDSSHALGMTTHVGIKGSGGGSLGRTAATALSSKTQIVIPNGAKRNEESHLQ